MNTALLLERFLNLAPRGYPGSHMLLPGSLPMDCLSVITPKQYARISSRLVCGNSAETNCRISLQNNSGTNTDQVSMKYPRESPCTAGTMTQRPSIPSMFFSTVVSFTVLYVFSNHL